MKAVGDDDGEEAGKEEEEEEVPWPSCVGEGGVSDEGSLGEEKGCAASPVLAGVRLATSVP